MIEMTSRTDATGISHPSGSRGVTQYYADNIIPLPSGSLPPIRPLEPLDTPHPNFYRGLMFATPVALFLWGFIALICWALFF